MKQKTRIYLRLAIGLTLAIVFDTVQQLAWKVGTAATSDIDSPLAALAVLLHEPLLGLVAIIMVLRFFNWLMVLKIADLSFAQPITAISYVTVTVASAILLHENMTVVQVAGVLLIFAGVWCISQTGFVSPTISVRSS